jgi:hypothetical protein
MVGMVPVLLFVAHYLLMSNSILHGYIVRIIFFNDQRANIPSNLTYIGFFKLLVTERDFQ